MRHQSPHIPLEGVLKLHCLISWNFCEYFSSDLPGDSALKNGGDFWWIFSGLRFPGNTVRYTDRKVLKNFGKNSEQNSFFSWLGLFFDRLGLAPYQLGLFFAGEVFFFCRSPPNPPPQPPPPPPQPTLKSATAPRRFYRTLPKTISNP